MPAPYTPIVISKALVERAGMDDARIDPLKLQKLLFFAHGWHLAIRSRPLLTESFAAWEYGPVVPSIYRAFKIWGAHLIPRDDPDLSRAPDLPPEDNFVPLLIDRVWSQYGGLSGVQLSGMTHRAGTPWSRVRASSSSVSPVIPNEQIRAHFRALARERENDE